VRVYKRGPTYWFDFAGPDGKRHRRSTKTTTRREAEQALALAVANAYGTAPGEPLPSRPSTTGPLPPTLAMAAEEYIADRTRRGKRSASYNRLSRWVEAFGDCPIHTLTSETIRATLNAWSAAGGWSGSTFNTHLAALSGLLSYAYARSWITRHPIHGGLVESLPANPGRTRWLRPFEVEALLTELRRVRDDGTDFSWVADIVTFAVYTGMRRTALFDLRVGDVQRDGAGVPFVFLERDKNGERVFKRLQGPAAKIADRLCRGRVPAAYLFATPDGTSARWPVLRRYLPQAVRAIGLVWGRGDPEGITMHSFRHTMASIAHNSGVNPAVVQRMGNWKSSAMMKKYAHLSADSLTEGEAVLADVLDFEAHGTRGTFGTRGKVETASGNAVND